jgi:uncharacterized protein (TIGR02246 family)
MASLWFFCTAWIGLVVASMPFASAIAGPTEDAAAVQVKWSEAFARMDVDGIAALYTDDALFYGASQPLYRGVSGVRQYFTLLPAAEKYKVEFADMQVVAYGTDVITSAGAAYFTFESKGQTKQLPLRITLTFVRKGADWKIASHHVSPKTN